MQAPVAVPPASATPVERADLLVIGGGILGLATAREMLVRRPGLRVLVVEREPELAAHQTGHNSGVVHAGLYYTPGSLKARLCREGKVALEAYCAERGIEVQRVGKLVVALTEDELPRFEALETKARENGVEGLETVGPERMRELEPHALRDPRAVVAGDRHRRLPGGRQRLRRRHPGRGRDDRDGAGT